MLSKLSKLDWYWHRLCAMSPGEVLLRVQRSGSICSKKNLRPWTLLSQRSNNGRQTAPGFLLLRFGHRILQVDQDDVGSAASNC